MLNMENTEPLEFTVWTDTDIQNAIKLGIDMERKGTVKEGYSQKWVDRIVKIEMIKFKDNKANGTKQQD